MPPSPAASQSPRMSTRVAPASSRLVAATTAGVLTGLAVAAGCFFAASPPPSPHADSSSGSSNTAAAIRPRDLPATFIARIAGLQEDRRWGGSDPMGGPTRCHRGQHGTSLGADTGAAPTLRRLLGR